MAFHALFGPFFLIGPPINMLNKVYVLLFIFYCQAVFACLHPMYSVNSILLVRSLAVDLVAFGENVLLVKTSRGIIWAESLLLGTSVLGSYTEK